MIYLEKIDDTGYDEAFHVYQNNNIIGIVAGNNKHGFGMIYQSFRGKDINNMWLHCSDVHITKEAAAEHLIGNLVDSINEDKLSELYISLLKQENKEMKEPLEFICFKKNGYKETVAELRHTGDIKTFVLDKESVETRLSNLQKSNLSHNITECIINSWPS